MTVILGETNTDGSGSSVNLTGENGELVLGTYVDGDAGVLALDGDTRLGEVFDTATVYSDNWDQDGYKEAKIDGSYDRITVSNIVDVDITNDAGAGVSHIEVLYAKRGQIDTSASDTADSIFIAVTTNNDHWSNTFEVTTGAGNDFVEFYNVVNSQLTGFDVDLGEGNDTFDISELNVAASNADDRYVDGGEGLDVLIYNGDSAVDFAGFEVVTGSDVSVTLDSDLLAANASSELGLVVADIELELSDDISASVSEELSGDQVDYLSELGYDASDFVAVDVITEDGAYAVLSNDDSWAVA